MKRQTDTPALYKFITEELLLPCIPYKTSLVRCFHAIPTETKFDVYINDELLASELSYKQFSYYIPVLEAENHNVKVFISGENGTPIIDKQIRIRKSNVETLAIVGSIENPDILPIVGDPTLPSYPDKSVIRYANLSPNNIVINVSLNGDVIQSGPVNINEFNEYSLLNPIMYKFDFINPNNNSQTSSTHILKPTRIYTFYLVGSLDPNSSLYLSHPLELVISVDITTLIKQCP